MTHESIPDALSQIEDLTLTISLWLPGDRCICQHEPHDGECPELVMSGSGTMPCGCSDYCPDRS